MGAKTTRRLVILGIIILIAVHLALSYQALRAYRKTQEECAGFDTIEECRVYTRIWDVIRTEADGI